MHNDTLLLSFTFPSLTVGSRETPPDLVRWLYKGGAATRPADVRPSIASGRLGSVRIERLALVRSVHRTIDDKLAAGGRQDTAFREIEVFNRFVLWVDEVDAALTIDGLIETYVKWTEHLLYLWKVKKTLKQTTVYDNARSIGHQIDKFLGRQKPVLHVTRVTKPNKPKTPLGPEAEKQNLENTFAFGHLLRDICDGLTLEVVWGSFKVQVQRVNGEVLKLWTGGRFPTRDAEWSDSEVRQAKARERAYVEARSLEHRGRRAVVNTRILAELLMFIGQTGLNLAQAHSLKFQHFSYTSSTDGYAVRDYKHRRDGEVLFHIFSAYRPFFERYLAWRREIFPSTDQLFPVLRRGALNTRAPLFDLIKVLCKKAGVVWTPPSALRGTRVNWLLRKTGDPEMAAELAQHDVETLLKHYEKPSLQRALSEVTVFWQKSELSRAKDGARNAVAPGECDGVPAPVTEKPKSAPAPDCVRPSGCLWCEHHRDIDSLEYVWGLASFRHLKVIELSKYCPPPGAHKTFHPAQHAVDKLSAKLSWFKASSASRQEWVEVALARVADGRYHPDWEGIINGVEGGE